MNEQDSAMAEIFADVEKLVKKAAHPKRRVLKVSPETVQLLDQLETMHPAVAVPEKVAVVPEKPTPEPEKIVSELRKPEISAVVKPAPPVIETVSTPVPVGNNAEQLAALAAVVAQCTQCSLHTTRTQTVFGKGMPTAGLVFVGEAPGEEEDLQGKPFVGRAGKLLTDIIEKGMELSLDEVYICNVLKCRPPNNRDPLPEEKAVCEPFLIQQLDILKPRVICALGTHAAQTLLKSQATIGQLRGKWHFYHGIPLRATYHPAYLLRSPGEKKKTWMDVLEVLKVYRGEVDPRMEG